MKRRNKGKNERKANELRKEIDTSLSEVAKKLVQRGKHRNNFVKIIELQLITEKNKKSTRQNLNTLNKDKSQTEEALNECIEKYRTKFSSLTEAQAKLENILRDNCPSSIIRKLAAGATYKEAKRSHDSLRGLTNVFDHQEEDHRELVRDSNPGISENASGSNRIRVPVNKGSEPSSGYIQTSDLNNFVSEASRVMSLKYVESKARLSLNIGKPNPQKCTPAEWERFVAKQRSQSAWGTL